MIDLDDLPCLVSFEELARTTELGAAERGEFLAGMAGRAGHVRASKELVQSGARPVPQYGEFLVRVAARDRALCASEEHLQVRHLIFNWVIAAAL